jgi:preprotein translocase subunit SecA
MLELLKKLFDTSEKDVKALEPTVHDINELEPQTEKLSDEELRGKTDEFKQRLKDGQALEDFLPEAFAVVREASRRTLGMRHFDVQMIGGLVLHQGRIAEMKTGEGKTLVATCPMYLNALTGRGAHLVTVNDYLARRDAVWMGAIYHFLGLSVGIIQGQSQDNDELGGSFKYDPTFEHDDPRYLHLRPCTRREAYLCDITYGTNHEFGFDYLRDNMAFQKEGLSMRDLNYAIIDEVDSILVDEARTPHIISGPSTVDVSVYKQVDKIVRKMEEGEDKHYTINKKNNSASLTEEGMDFFEQEWGIENIANDPLLFHHLNASVKAHGLFEKNVDYVVRNHEVVIVDENTGRLMFGRRYSDGLHQALEAKEGVEVKRESQTVATITFQNLFRMYGKLAGMTGTAKTEEDEFRKIYGLDVVAVPTHRPMVRDDQQDAVFKSLDAKYRGIGRELLRVYTKQQPVLVGTRSIEMSEMVSTRITGENLQKLILTDYLFDKMESEKSVANEAKKDWDKIYGTPLPEINSKTLANVMNSVGLAASATSDEVVEWFLKKHELPDENREYLLEALKHGIPHNILNAKYHEKEAAIISEAGRKGAVTIATNMAGRGVDILLGGRVADETVAQARAQEEVDQGTVSDYADTFMSFRRGGQERAAPPLPLDEQERAAAADEVRELGGLYILGTERHESRRIDNQLRGRAGRQGDPGVSKFFVSLEDQLWKIFNAKMLENPALKAWPDMEEVNQKFITRMIQKTQERIENHYFEARKHVLEYDDVLNSQREHIYSVRREILLGKDVHDELLAGVRETVREQVQNHQGFDEDGHPTFDYEGLYNSLNEMFPLVDYLSQNELKELNPEEGMVEKLTDVASQAFEKRVEELGEERDEVERQIMLQAVNSQWMKHLQMNDYIREGIGLRGYGQTDPLVAYRQEAFELFEETKRGIRDAAVKMLFNPNLKVRRQQPAVAPKMKRIDASALQQGGGQQAQPTGGAQTAAAGAGAATASATGEEPKSLDDVDWKQVGRNEPCPCGSGKKFKNCHYPELRRQGTI